MPQSSPNRIKRVAAIHDLSAFGRCALTVVIPTLSAMGIQVIPLPTALMSTHTGGFTDIYALDLSDSMEKMYAHWETLGVTFDAIYSGFVLGARQCRIISDFERRFRNGDTLLLTDPVFGDDGALYSTCSQDTVGEMRELCRGSDIITPNLTEACMLCGQSIPDTAEMPAKQLTGFITELLHSLGGLGVGKIVVTGIPVSEGDRLMVSTAAVDLTPGALDNSPFFVSLPRLPARFHGTGELFASVLLGRLLGGWDFPAAVSAASAFVRDVIDFSASFGTPVREGISLEPCLSKLFP